MLVKDGSALERLAEADRTVFDKTGTLTLGRPQPLALETLSPLQKQLALALAETSRHPLSSALRRALVAEGVAPAAVTDIAEVPGQGVFGRWQGKTVSVGRSDDAGETLAVALQIGDASAGSDPLRRPAAARLRRHRRKRWQRLACQASILSGDRAAAVLPVARQLGLAAAADLSPTGQAGRHWRLKAKGDAC